MAGRRRWEGELTGGVGKYATEVKGDRKVGRTGERIGKR